MSLKWSGRNPRAVVLVLTLLLGVVGEARANLTLRDDWGSKIIGSAASRRAGDVNGDGVEDVLLARGRTAWVVFGDASRRKVVLDEMTSEGFAVRGPRGIVFEIATAGDVDGDGLADILLGAQDARITDRGVSGAAWVVFGKATFSTVYLSRFVDGAINAAGFKILGYEEGSLTGNGVAGLGDINGDGLDDVAIGAPFGGALFVVFGQATTDWIDLQTFDPIPSEMNGFKVETPVPYASDGWEVAKAGDVNGDGTPDIAVGILQGGSSPGSAYVVFGKEDVLPLDINLPGAWGYRIKGMRRGDRVGTSLSGGGDVNGDGMADVILGASRPLRGSGSLGRAAVVFGKDGSSTVELSDLGDGGFNITGIEHRGFGVPVCFVGDANADGKADVCTAAPAADHGGENSGSLYVVYGKSDSARVAAGRLEDRGFRVDGKGPGSILAGGEGLDDLDGDGNDDLLVRALGDVTTFLVWKKE